jgi:hypothetical protein
MSVVSRIALDRLGLFLKRKVGICGSSLSDLYWLSRQVVFYCDYEAAIENTVHSFQA